MRYLQLLSPLLLCVVWAAAQDSSQTSPTQSSPNPSSSAQTRSDGNDSTTVQGCLSGTSGSYTLTDKNGMTYQLTGDNAKLAEHVGHTIQVTGNTNAGSANPSGSSTSGMGQTNPQQTLQVTSMKHISKTCSK